MRDKAWIIGLLLIGCAGTMRSCSGCSASEFGADWVIVQMDNAGHPYRCWTLEDASVGNEEHSDGIYWLSPDGHLVHLGGHYNRVQVEGEKWDSAFAEVGLTRETCEAIQAQRFELGVE